MAINITSSSVEYCSHQMMNKAQKLTALYFNSPKPAPKCVTAFSIISMVITFVGIIVNILNIFILSKGVRYSPRVRFLLVVALLDLALLVLQLPQLVVASESGQIQATHRAAYGGYAILLYTFAFILTTCYTWMLVAMVIHHWFQTRDNNEMTDVLSSEVNASNQDKYTSTKFRTCNIAIATVAVVSTSIHIIKMFEFTVNSDLMTPSLLLKRQSLQSYSYEVYSLIMNMFVSFLLPYLFLLATAIYYLLIKVKMRNASDPPPCGQQLLLWLCVSFVITHALSLFIRFAPLTVSSYSPFVSCEVKVDEMLTTVFLAGKVLLYLGCYEVYKYCLKQRFDASRPNWLRSKTSYAIRMGGKQDRERAPDTSFENPIYGAPCEQDVQQPDSESKI